MLYPHSHGLYFISTSPLPSPLASPKTSSKWRGSYSSVNQQGDCDSLLKWLKSLRLHKYHAKFENLTYDEFSQMTVEEFETRGMTTGAAKKLHKKLEELKMYSFCGFRDMPFSGGMSRKLSTCSLPAALLMEQNLTPSSSCERFSPTGSTCSLDKYGPGGSGDHRTLTSSHIYHRSTQEVRSVGRHSNSETLPASSHVNGPLNGSGEGGGAIIVDTAILKTISSSSQSAAKSTTNPSSRGVDAHRSSDQSTALRTNSAVAANGSAAVPSGGLASNGPRGPSPTIAIGNRTKHGSGSPGLHNSSWADTAEGEADRPVWAQLPHSSNGEAHSGAVHGNGNKVQSHASTGIRHHTGIGPVHVDSAGLQYQYPHQQQHHHSRSSGPSPRHSGPSPHPPIHGYHVHPNSKRNSHESLGGSHNNIVAANSTDIIIPQPLHPAMARNQVGMANWSKSVHPPYLHPTIVSSQQQPQRTGRHIVHHNQNNSSANGLLRGPFLTQNRTHNVGGGILMFPPGSVIGPYASAHPVGGHHSHPPPPVVCYNCGKRGHLGNTCPGVTMDDSDNSSFHKQLERVVDEKAAH